MIECLKNFRQLSPCSFRNIWGFIKVVGWFFSKGNNASVVDPFSFIFVQLTKNKCTQRIAQFKLGIKIEKWTRSCRSCLSSWRLKTPHYFRKGVNFVFSVHWGISVSFQEYWRYKHYSFGSVAAIRMLI